MYVYVCTKYPCISVPTPPCGERAKVCSKYSYGCDGFGLRGMPLQCASRHVLFANIFQAALAFVALQQICFCYTYILHIYCICLFIQSVLLFQKTNDPKIKRKMNGLKMVKNNLNKSPMKRRKISKAKLHLWGFQS